MPTYTGGAYILYSELFDRKPDWAEVTATVVDFNRLHTVLLLSRVNNYIRHAMDSHDREDLNWVQSFLVRNFIDDAALRRLQERFPDAEMRSRPIFHPLQILNMIRIAAVSCTGDESRRPDESEALRFQLGTACLMMNDLLLNEEEELAIAKGPADKRETHLMAQLLTMWEIMNPAHAHGLLFRSHVMFRQLLRDRAIRDNIRAKCRGFDIEERFGDTAGIELSKWLSLLFATYAFYASRGKKELIEEPQVFVMSRRAFGDGSGVTQSEMDAFLATVSTPFDDLCETVGKERPADPRFDFIPFRSRPLYLTAKDSFACIDTSFVLEKLYSGVHWLLHDRLPQSERSDLFTAWGLLFQRYVDWLFNGGLKGLPAAYFPFPRWDDGNESFDGVFLKDSILVPMEYKGGFLSQNAKYSASAEALTGELERKIVPGCVQLASKIGHLFAVTTSKRKTLPGVPVQHVSRILPLLIVQDHALRGLSVNWWLNRRFQELMGTHQVRATVEVLPLNVVNIEDLEQLVESSDGGGFDFIYSLHNKAVRDPAMKSQLHNFLWGAPGYGTREGHRWNEIDRQIQEEMFSYTFPNEWKDQQGPAK